MSEALRSAGGRMGLLNILSKFDYLAEKMGFNGRDFQK